MMEGSAEFARLGVSGEEWLPLVTGDIVNVPSWAYHGFRNASGASRRAARGGRHSSGRRDCGQAR